MLGDVPHVSVACGSANSRGRSNQHNDLPMLTRAGLPIAMGNAPDDVKKQASKVTRSNDEDGVAHAIDTIILSSTENAK